MVGLLENLVGANARGMNGPIFIIEKWGRVDVGAADLTRHLLYLIGGFHRPADVFIIG